MRMGKLSASELQKVILDKLSHTREEVVLSASQGEDCAALKCDDYILLSSDPITAQMPLKSLGELVVDVCCNDVAANGGRPFALMLTVIMPPFCAAEDIETIMSAAVAKAGSLNVDIIGGHTEFSDCVTRPIVCGTAVGRCSRLIAKTALKTGDRLFVTKTLGMEGTAIMTDGGERLYGDEIGLAEEYRANLSVEPEARLLSGCASVTMMHDITEGGVAGAVAEVCLGCGKGARIFEDKFPVSALTERLCRKYDINPARLISSGSMLFACRDDSASEILKAAGMAVTEIGTVTEGEITLVDKSGNETAIRPEPDEIYKFLTRYNR